MFSFKSKDYFIKRGMIFFFFLWRSFLVPALRSFYDELD